VLNDRLKQKITVIAKSGANIYNNAHYYKVKKAVKKAKNPVVIVWLGTCDVLDAIMSCDILGVPQFLLISLRWSLK
jgi:hypothetical protein